MPGAEDEASSTTHSAIAPGTIATTKEKTDLSQINRDTANALNKLDHIFDKKTIEEKQELAKLFAKNGNELIHKVSEHYGWADGDANKGALHTLIGGLTAQIAGGNFSSGAWAAGVNEQLSREILKLADGDPAKAQLYSAVVGAVVNSLTGDEVETGSATALYGTKWNELVQYTSLPKSERQIIIEIDTLSQAVNRYKAELSETAMNVARGMAKEFPADYNSTTVTFGAGIKAGSASIIVDKFGQVYVSVGFAPGFSIGAPLTSGFGYINKDGLNGTDNEGYYRNTITGTAVSAQGIVGGGGTIGVSSSGFYEEINVGGNAGASVTIGYTWYVGRV